MVDGSSLAGTGSDWCRIEDVYSTLQSSYSLTSEKRSDFDVHGGGRMILHINSIWLWTLILEYRVTILRGNNLLLT